MRGNYRVDPSECRGLTAPKTSYGFFELRAARLLRLTVQSVNQPIPARFLNLPGQALLNLGLPIRHVAMEATKKISQAAALVMANLNILRAFSLGDPPKGREAMIQIRQNLAKVGEGKGAEKVASHDQLTEKVLAVLILEQWEGAWGAVVWGALPG